MKKILFLFATILISNYSYGGNFKTDTTRGCLNTVITFQETGGGVGWEWDFGDSSSKVYTNPAAHPYYNSGIFTVTCRVTYSNGTTELITKTNYIIISSGPSVSLIANKTIICPGETIAFYAIVHPGGNAVNSYLWNFGDGSTSNLANPGHLYSSSGTRSVSLKVTDTIGCFNKVDSINYILIKPEPIANFAGSDSVFCVHNTSDTRQITFSNQSSSDATTFYWDFGDSTHSTQKNPSTKTYGVGSYTVKLIASNNYGCKDTLIKSNYIAVVIFEASFKASDTVLCGLGKTVTFTGTGYGTNFYKWNFGNGLYGVGTIGVTTTYNNPGKYTITTIATSRLGCSDTLVKQQAIWVYEDHIKPIFEIHDTDHCNPNASIICINHPIGDSTDDLGLSHVEWDFGDNTPYGYGDSVSHIYGNFGSFPLKIYVTTAYGCVFPAYTQNIDIYKLSASVHQTIPDISSGAKAGGCFPLTVQLKSQNIVSSSPIINHIWDWGESELWGSSATPDTTQTGTGTFGNYIYNYDTGIYMPTLYLINAQGCRDTIHSNPIPVGRSPLNDWTFTPVISCKSALQISATAYDSTYNHSLVAQARANAWEWYDSLGHLMAHTNPAQLTAIDTGWNNGYYLIAYHNDCPGNTVKHNKLMYACPPIIGIASPSSDLQGNTPIYCNWSPFDFDGGNGQNTRAWDSCVWRLGNDYHDTNGIYHPQTLILPTNSNPRGEIHPQNQYQYDSLGGLRMLKEHKGKLFVTLWAMNDNRNGNNRCGFCVDSVKQEINISIASLKLRALDIDSSMIHEICEDQTLLFYDSSYASDEIYAWGLSVWDSLRNMHYSTAEMMNNTKQAFTHPNNGKPSSDTINHVSNAFRYMFTDAGTYYIYLKDTSRFGCGMNNPSHPPFINEHIGPYENRTDTLRLVVNPKSIPAFTSNSPICFKDTLYITDSSYTLPPFENLRITNYLWRIGTLQDTTQNPKFNVNSPGLYGLSLKITNEKGCDTSFVTVNPITVMGLKVSFTTPNLPPPNNRKVCNKENVIFKNSSSYYSLTYNTMIPLTPSTSGLAYLWIFDKKDTVRSLNAQHTFNVDSSCWVHISLTITDMNGCTNSYTDSIWVIRPHSEFISGIHESNCPQLNVHFQDLSYAMDLSKASYKWDFGDTLNANYTISYLKNPVHTYPYAGTYSVKLIVTDEFGCTDTMIKPNYVKVGGPFGTFHNDTAEGCVPLKVIFSFSINNADTFYIFYGDGSSDMNTFIGAPMKHTYTSPGQFIPFMQLIKWDFNYNTGRFEKCVQGFALNDTISVLHFKPDFSIENSHQDILTNGAKALNINDSAYFNDKSEILPASIPVSYRWNFGDGQSNSSLVYNLSHQYNDTGIYLVELQIQHKSCVTKKVHTLRVDYPDNVIEPKGNSSLFIYPNPVQSQLYIQSDMSIESVEIIDLLGKIVIKSNYNLKCIDVSQLNKGVYFIRIKTENNTINRKIIKI